jgi:hypothetical protein
VIRVLDAAVDLQLALGHHRHCLVAQLPVRLQAGDHGYQLADREEAWAQVRSVLELVAAGDRNLRKLGVLMFPESAVPADRLDDVLATVEARFGASTVTTFGLEHVPLRTFRALLGRFQGDNAEALELVQRDVDAGAPLDIPVNWACVAIKEASGRLRVFLEAKSHPFQGEEFLDKDSDLYRGRHFYLFRGQPCCFNFMVLICFDYLYRDLYASNIRRVIDRANQLYFTTRQTLDALFVLQCNPKPEHHAFREVLAGFYGEYLEDTPGVRDTVTVFGNCSDESRIDRYRGSGTFGASSVVFGPRYRLARVEAPEFSTDDFGGAPLCRLRFGTATRLYYFNLPIQHELDPRSSRLPLKVHRVLRLGPGGAWEQVGSERDGDSLRLER